MPHYKLIPVPAANVTLTDSFWKPRIETAFHEGFDWVTLHFDPNNGGYRTFRESQRRDTVKVEPVTTFESIKVLEAAARIPEIQRGPRHGGLYGPLYRPLGTQAKTNPDILRASVWETNRFSAM